MAKFMDLSAEVRVMIYELCLVVGKIFPYRSKHFEEEGVGHTVTGPTLASLRMIGDDQTCLDPCLGLLGVNKLIKSECTPILYQKNTVILPYGPLAARFFQNCLNSVEKRRLLRDVELELCDLDMPASVKTAIINASHSLSKRHQSLKYHLGHVIWPAKIAPILNDTKLKRLTVYFQRSRCPMDCCILDSRASAVFRKGFATGVVPELCLQGLTPFLPQPVDNNRPANPDFDESGFGIMAQAAVSDGFYRTWLFSRADRMGEQIALWTKAKGLGKEDDYADFRWFREGLREDDEDKGISGWGRRRMV